MYTSYVYRLTLNFRVPRKSVKLILGGMANKLQIVLVPAYEVSNGLVQLHAAVNASVELVYNALLAFANHDVPGLQLRDNAIPLYLTGATSICDRTTAPVAPVLSAFRKTPGERGSVSLSRCWINMSLKMNLKSLTVYRQ